MLLDLFHSQPKDTALRGYVVDEEIVRGLITTSSLRAGCGLYLGTELGAKIHGNKELIVGTITHPHAKRLLGLTINLGSIPFDFFG